MRKLSITEKQLEEVEENLLTALKSIDKANAIIWEANEFLNDAQQLSKLKGQIKTILNRHYDACAVEKMRNEIKNELNNKPK